MLNRLKNTLKHSAIYSIGNISTKLIGFVLLPLYTKHITVSDYGILTIIEVTILILTQVLVLGQTHSIIRFYNLREYEENRKSIFFTLFTFLCAIVLLFNLISQPLTSKLSSFFSAPSEFAFYFRLSFYIISIRIINSFSLSVLRAKEKSAFYATGNIIKTAIILGLNIYFVAIVKIGVKGILYSYLIGDGILFLILLSSMVSEITPKFNYKILRDSIPFGFPFVFASLAGTLLMMGDRYILKLLINYREVGLYNLGYKIAGVINVFLVQSFQLSLFPSIYKIYGQKGDKRYYSKMLTYFVFVLIVSGLALSMFGSEFVKLLALNPDYWNAYKVIPFITLAYILFGARLTVSIGLFLKKKTKFIAYNTIGAMILNIGLDFLLIPKYKMIGAAVATIISSILLYIATYFVANRFYKIPYENVKLVKMLILAIVLFFLSTLTTNLNILPRILIKVAIIISFPFILYPMNFYEPIEILRIKQSWQKWRKKLVNW